jgi:hypothetical protein
VSHLYGGAGEEDQKPWCERCEWNLEAYAPPADWPWYARSIASRDHRAGFRADLGLTAVDPDAISGVSRGYARLRQLTIRTDASLFASHPTIGRRYQFLAARPPLPAAVTLTEQYEM